MARGYRRELLIYRTLLWLLALPLALHAAWQAMKGHQMRYLRERFGWLPAPADKRPLWLHAASVGEVNALLPLVNLLHARHPQLPLLITTTTTSGARYLQNKLPAPLPHAYLPLDYPGAVRRFLTTVQPRAALIMETELWPHLFSGCAARQIPLLLINGRLSGRTLRAPKWLRRLYGYTLSHVTTILARGESDRLGFLALGAAADRCQVVGNIKFSAAPRTEGVEPINLGRRYVLAASTREGEEKLLLEGWKQIASDTPLLVIAPRHPNRLNEIIKAAQGYRMAIRSRNETIDDSTQLYIADTFGELPALMAGAELVFMGGSLVPKGGQNLLEPASLGKAEIFGPHVENFSSEAAILLGAEGALQVQDSNGFAEAVQELLNNGPRRDQLGENARAAVESRRNMVERYYTALLPLCGKLFSA